MTNESKTLFIPLYGKALMSKEGFFYDLVAERIVEHEKENLKDVDQSRKLAIYMAMRAMQFDEIAEDFIRKNTFNIIINLGCGLDCRVGRVTSYHKWYDLDFPDVIELRKKYITDGKFNKTISSSVTDLSWLDEIEYKNENVLVLAEGLSMYLSETDMKNLIEQFSKRFNKTLFVFDAYSVFSAKMSKYKNPINAVNAKIDFAMDDPTIFENNNTKCVINNDIILRKYVNHLKGIDKLRFKFMGSAGKNMYRIYGYEINKAATE